MSRHHPIPGWFLIATGLLATVLWSSPTLGAVINVPADQPTIQAAFSAAALFGDEIVLADGTYSGAGNRSILFDKHVTIRSASGDPRLCIIDCQGLGRAFLFDGVVSAARLEAVTIINGSAYQGGGIAFTNSSATVINCRIIGNKATGSGGGGIGVDNSSSPAIINCVLSGNFRSGIGVVGGGLYVTGGSTPVLTNCTFGGNTAWDASSIKSTGSGTTTTLVNCIIWGEDPGSSGILIQSSGGAVNTITYSLIEGGFPGIGNLDTNPGLLDADGPDGIPATPDNDLRISRFSPCIDAGDNTAPGLSGVTTDYLGGTRFVDDANVANVGNGGSPLVDMGANEHQVNSIQQEIQVPATAATIQAGIDLAQLGDHVVIADGIYTGGGNRDLRFDKDITVRSASGNPNACVIDCQGATRGVSFEFGATENARLESVTITNGSSPQGGGIAFSRSDAMVLNCRITNSKATGTGGGGVAVDQGSSPSLVNCTLSGNYRSGIGVLGGGMYVLGGSTPSVINCTFSGNTAWDASAVQSTGSGTVTTLVNCIVWGNDPGISGIRIKDASNSTTNVSYSDIEGGFSGVGNLNSNPIFADTDFRLAPISPCLDVGDNSAVLVDIDCDGNQRIYDGDGDNNPIVDMGAFEYGSTSVVGIGDDPAPGFRPLLRVWPNPAPGRSHVRFTLATGGEVSLEVYDLSGRRVRILVQKTLDPGIHTATWNGKSDSGGTAPAGVYFFRLFQNNTTSTRKVLRVP